MINLSLSTFRSSDFFLTAAWSLAWRTSSISAMSFLMAASRSASIFFNLVFKAWLALDSTLATSFFRAARAPLSAAPRCFAFCSKSSSIASSSSSLSLVICASPLVRNPVSAASVLEILLVTVSTRELRALSLLERSLASEESTLALWLASFRVFAFTAFCSADTPASSALSARASAADSLSNTASLAPSSFLSLLVTELRRLVRDFSAARSWDRRALASDFKALASAFCNATMVADNLRSSLALEAPSVSRVVSPALASFLMSASNSAVNFFDS
mmetsp:Transcript_52187/g.114558  ORF Transcript_52187/g.114558 Transcript_52187/m.114558 type:complete len:275 (-) Transcript_52187:696-1520(-)